MTHPWNDVEASDGRLSDGRLTEASLIVAVEAGACQTCSLCDGLGLITQYH